MRFKNITCFGFADAKPDDKLYKDATEVAKLLAEAGYTIVNGGGPGVMRATTEGAHLGGGRAIGITFEPAGMTFYEGRDPENKVDELIVLPDYITRTLKLMEEGEAYIIFNGGTGTLSELGMSWALARLHLGHSKPFILFGGFWYPIMEEITRLMRIRKEELGLYRIAVESRDVVPLLVEYEAQYSNEDHEHKEVPKDRFSI